MGCVQQMPMISKDAGVGLLHQHQRHDACWQCEALDAVQAIPVQPEQKRRTLEGHRDAVRVKRHLISLGQFRSV